MRRELEKLQEYIASGQIFVDGANFATTISRSVLEFFGVHVDFNNAVEDGKNASVQYFEHPYLPFLTVLTMVVLFKL
jgi:hypothetical protein